MSITAFMFKTMAARSDAKRDASLVIPEDILTERDINYAGNNDKYNLMDICRRREVKEPQPAIISIHGGGYVYGTKEVYKHYAAFLAGLGFTVVNFNYHLAPKAKFPSQLSEINMVMEWVRDRGEQHQIDLNNIFLVGDSAGAQMCSQYAAIYSNPEYERLFPFKAPKELKIRAIALNCGVYAFSETAGGEDNKKLTRELYKLYVGRDDEEVRKQLDVLSNIKSDYPPTFVMTSYYDFLKQNAKPMYEFLRSKGVEAEYRCYGTEDTKYMAHVCHVNMNLNEAKEINREETSFFKEYLG